MEDNKEKAGDSSKIKLVIFAVVIVALLFLAKQFNVQDLLILVLDRIQALGPLGVVIFIGIYILACVLFLPGSVLTLGAGVVFGVVMGTVYVSIASTLGATCAFLAGRYLARSWVEKKIQGNDKFKVIDDAVAKEGWKIVGLTRLSPVFPFNLLNYAYGVTKVSLKDYFLASWIGMLPGTVMYVYIGSLAGSLATLGSGDAGSSAGPAQWTIRLVGFAATVAVTVYVTRVAKKALAGKIKEK